MTTEFEAIGTHWHIDLKTSVDTSTLVSHIRERIEKFEAVYSRFRPQSLITRMSQRAGTYTLPEDAEPMWTLYKELYQLTGGAFTPLIGSLLSEAGYDATYSLTPKTLHKPPAWEDVIDDSRYPEISLKKPVLIDVGSIGKGYLIDIVGTLLEENGIRDYCINAGGDIRHRSASSTPLRVALEHPMDFSLAAGMTTICNESLCGSAGSRRAWNQYHHIMDPRTLASPRHILTAWIKAKTTRIADALATCLFLVSAEELRPQFDFEYLILRPNMSAERSTGWKGELF